MSDRPTPETDALREAIDNGAAVESEMTSFAMKLERERDEARKEAEYYKERYEQIKDERDEEIQKVLKERDEALSQIYQAEDRAARFCQERDEAREVFREIAEASGFDNIGNWARNKALEALKTK